LWLRGPVAGKAAPDAAFVDGLTRPLSPSLPHRAFQEIHKSRYAKSCNISQGFEVSRKYPEEYANRMMQ